MPVNTQNEEYLEYLPLWELVRNCLAGEYMVKAAGERYIPQKYLEKDADYRIRLDRATFYGAVGRAQEAYHGLIFQKDPAQENVPAELEEILKNVDLAGTDVDQFMSNISWDCMPANWGGILVDYPSSEAGESRAEAKAKGHRAYLTWYPAESAIRWKYDTINNSRKLSLVVLKEQRLVPKADDPFVDEAREVYRELRIEDGRYIQRVYARVEGGLVLETSVPIEPRINGEALDFIPFFPCPGEVPEKSMEYDLACENIGHWKQSVIYADGLHYHGTPSLVLVNAKPSIDPVTNKPKDVVLGQIILLDSEGGVTPEIKYIEPSGQSLQENRTALENSEKRMVALGPRILGADTRGVEAADTARIHRAGENGVLSAYARNMSDKYTQAIRLMAKWNDIDADDYTYSLNTDYDVKAASEAIIAAILAQEKTPTSVKFKALKNAGYLDEEMDMDSYIEQANADNADSEKERRLAMLEVDSGLMSKEWYLEHYRGLSGADLQKELAATEKQEPELDTFGFDEGEEMGAAEERIAAEEGAV